jgi:hypothetical protein
LWNIIDFESSTLIYENSDINHITYENLIKKKTSKKSIFNLDPFTALIGKPVLQYSIVYIMFNLLRYNVEKQITKLFMSVNNSIDLKLLRSDELIISEIESIVGIDVNNDNNFDNRNDNTVNNHDNCDSYGDNNIHDNNSNNANYSSDNNDINDQNSEDNVSIVDNNNDNGNIYNGDCRSDNENSNNDNDNDNRNHVRDTNLVGNNNDNGDSSSDIALSQSLIVEISSTENEINQLNSISNASNMNTSVDMKTNVNTNVDTYKDTNNDMHINRMINGPIKALKYNGREPIPPWANIEELKALFPLLLLSPSYIPNTLWILHRDGYSIHELINSGVWALYDDAITTTIKNWGKEMPLKLSMLLNIFTKLKVKKIHLSYDSQIAISKAVVKAAPYMEARSLSNILFYIAKLDWPIFASALSSNTPILSSGSTDVRTVSNLSTVLNSPVNILKLSFLNKCSNMKGPGEFSNAFWAWAQVYICRDIYI